MANAFSLRMFWFLHVCVVIFFCITLFHFRSITSTTVTTTTTFTRKETDRLALLAIKASLVDPLGVMSSWNDSLHFCEWFGVICSRRHQRITVLDLQSSGLRGSLTPYIGNLSFLRELLLQNNTIQGKIPHEFGRLFRLQKLHLFNNSLEGEIPANLSRCINLEHLALGQNRLVGNVPIELDLLSKLKRLSIHKNNLSGAVPASLGNLSSLEALSASINNFNGIIPNSLGRLARLYFFGLGSNNLSGMIPPSIYNISSLSTLSVPLNQLHGSLPSDLGNALPNIEVLQLAVNQFTGTIPLSLSNASKLADFQIRLNKFIGKVSIDFGGLQNLWKLNLGFNHLGSGEEDDLRFLISLANDTSLKVLGISDNNFGGMLPKTIGNLSNQLRWLAIQQNQIFGSIPLEIENLINLEVLYTEQNQLSGGIPSGIGKLQKLQYLFMGGNRFSGEIPTSIGNLSSLIELEFSENNLQGSIPSSFGNCTRMILLDLSQNNLSGIIPREVITLSSLAIGLDLSQNILNGSLYVEVGGLRNLRALDISENKLSGEIPPNLGECTSLEFLIMEGNFFEGVIPQTLSSLSAIQVLYLSRNNLSGQIPKYLEKLPLKTLNLSFNDLEGEVPLKGVFKNISAFSIVGNKKLCGGIPKLKLRICNNINDPKKPRMSLALKWIIISLLSGLVALALIVFFLILYWLKRSKEDPGPATPISNSLLKLSYETILKATDGFSPANLIGAGSFGSVYKGIILDHQADESTNVAVKVLNLQHLGASKSFMAECEALRNIRHRNLLRIITTCSTIDFQGNDFKALIYEFMSNQSLEMWLHPDDGQEESHHLNLLHRLNIAIDVAFALEYLHHQCEISVVHCDLKPSNILLDSDMIAHVGDFGLARFSPAQTSSIGIKGTIGYAAPEYGIGNDVSTEGDVYSYGILLLEMFTGKRPTEAMFKDGMNLHSFAKMAIPERVIEIIDPILRFGGEEETVNNIQNQIHVASRDKLQECLTSIVRIGVACSMESPRDRMDIRGAINELHLVKDILLGTEIQINRRI